MSRYLWGLVAALLIAWISAVGARQGLIPTLTVALLVFFMVALVTTPIERFLTRAQTPRPRFGLIDAETVPWQIINGTLMSWCRIEVENGGAPGTVAVQLTGVRPFMQINGMGHNLRGLGRPAAEDGSVPLQHGQRQKFDLFWIGKGPGKQNNVPRKHRRDDGTILRGPRRLFSYGVCLKDGYNDLEYVNPEHRRYEFDVTVVSGQKRIYGTYEVCISPNAGPKIHRLR